MSLSIVNTIRRLLGRASITDITWPGWKPQVLRLQQGAASGDLHIMLLIDASGSMESPDIAPSRLAAAKKAARRLCRTIAAEQRTASVSFVSFASDAKLHGNQIPAQRRDAIHTALGTIESSGATNFAAGLELALMLMDMELNANHVVLLSDGGNTGSDPEPIGASLRARATVQCVGIGQRETVDEALLRRLASRGPNGEPLYTWIGDDAKALVNHYEQTALDIVRVP